MGRDGRQEVGGGGSDPDSPLVGRGSILAVLLSARGAFLAAAAFSGAINVLMLSGSLFMLQVYDRVLPSRSIPTLQALVLLIVILYGFIALLELVRSRLFARIGRHVDVSLSEAVFRLNLRRGLPSAPGVSASPFRDLDQLRTFLASGGPSAVFDLPWTPLYVVLLFVLHPWLGCLGLLGIVLLSSITWLTDRSTGPLQQAASQASGQASALAEAGRRGAETIVPLGMARPLTNAWRLINHAAGEAVLRNSDALSVYSGVSRFVRMTLQSFVLALGALLVISGHATGGVMIASSILLGRALAPVELSITHWRGFVAARQAYQRLKDVVDSPRAEPQTQLPPPGVKLDVQDLFVTPPGMGKPFLRGVRFELAKGDALGVIGPSGSGKTALARALVGVWPAAGGSVRFDGSTLDQWSEDVAGGFVGYMPQEIELFSGTVAQNIARFDSAPPPDKLLAAADAAGVSDFVRGLEAGFETQVNDRGSRFSAGQRQRLALARALYGDPFVVVLDEPNSALDAEGEGALTNAIAGVRRRGGVVVIIAHRPAALQSTNKVLVLADGAQQAFGPRDAVLKQVLSRRTSGERNAELVS